MVTTYPTDRVINPSYTQDIAPTPLESELLKDPHTAGVIDVVLDTCLQRDPYQPSDNRPTRSSDTNGHKLQIVNTSDCYLAELVLGDNPLIFEPALEQALHSLTKEHKPNSHTSSQDLVKAQLQILEHLGQKTQLPKVDSTAFWRHLVDAPNDLSTSEINTQKNDPNARYKWAITTITQAINQIKTTNRTTLTLDQILTLFEQAEKELIPFLETTKQARLSLKEHATSLGRKLEAMRQEEGAAIPIQIDRPVIIISDLHADPTKLTHYARKIVATLYPEKKAELETSSSSEDYLAFILQKAQAGDFVLIFEGDYAHSETSNKRDSRLLQFQAPQIASGNLEVVTKEEARAIELDRYAQVLSFLDNAMQGEDAKVYPLAGNHDLPNLRALSEKRLGVYKYGIENNETYAEMIDDPPTLQALEHFQDWLPLAIWAIKKDNTDKPQTAVLISHCQPFWSSVDTSSSSNIVPRTITREFWNHLFTYQLSNSALFDPDITLNKQHRSLFGESLWRAMTTGHPDRLLPPLTYHLQTMQNGVRYLIQGGHLDPMPTTLASHSGHTSMQQASLTPRTWITNPRRQDFWSNPDYRSTLSCHKREFTNYAGITILDPENPDIDMAMTLPELLELQLKSLIDLKPSQLHNYIDDIAQIIQQTYSTQSFTPKDFAQIGIVLESAQLKTQDRIASTNKPNLVKLSNLDKITDSTSTPKFTHGYAIFDNNGDTLCLLVTPEDKIYLSRM